VLGKKLLSFLKIRSDLLSRQRPTSDLRPEFIVPKGLFKIKEAVLSARVNGSSCQAHLSEVGQNLRGVRT
jgi:hypothetical protein